MGTAPDTFDSPLVLMGSAPLVTSSPPGLVMCSAPCLGGSPPNVVSSGTEETATVPYPDVPPLWILSLKTNGALDPVRVPVRACERRL
jgi:hypothetical protein